MNEIWLTLAATATLAALVLLIAVVRLRRSRQQVQRARWAIRNAFDELATVFEGLPDGLYRFDAETGRESCSARLAVLLGLDSGTDASIQDVLNRFGNAASQVLAPAVTLLRGQGRQFEMVLETADGKRRIQIIGVRTFTEGGRPRADLLWFRDLTAHLDGGDDPAQRAGDATALSFPVVAETLPLPLWRRDATTLSRTYANAATPDQDISRALAEQARQNGGLAQAVLSLPLDGVTIPCLVTEIDLGRDELGIDQGLVGYAHPVSSAQEAAVLENLAISVVVIDQALQVSYYNKAFAELWDLPATWLDSRPAWTDVLGRLREQRRLPPVKNFRDWRQRQLAEIAALTDGVEDFLHLPDGSTLHRSLIPLPGGGVIIADEDSTRGLELERLNTQLAQVQREILHRLHEGIAVFGANGRLRLCNPAFIELWNLQDQDLGAGPHMSDLLEMSRPLYGVTDTDWPEAKGEMAARLLSGDIEERSLERTDGRILRYASTQLPDEGVLVTYLDISDSARVEKALRERAEALSSADQMKTEFLADLSHEMRLSLNNVLGYAELLTGEYFGGLGHRQREYLLNIQDSGRDLETLLNDTVDLASVQGGQVALELDTLDLHDLLAGVIRLVRERLRRSDITLDFQCPSDIGWIIGDSRRLRQVFFHVLNSATKLSPPGEKVVVNAARDDGDSVITVSRAGTLRAVTEYPQDHALTAAGGLGMTLVEKFIHMHGGSVTVDSPSKGKVQVIVRLPK